MTSLLAETESRQTAANAGHLSELEQLQSEVEALRSVFKTATDGVLKELERERFNIAALRDAEHARVRELESRFRTIKLKQVELEARSNHQNIERDNIARAEKQYHQKRREWEDELMSGEFDEGAMLRQRLMQEVQGIKRARVKESYEDAAKLIEDGLRMVSDEVDHMRGEVSDLELTNQYLETRIRQAQKKPGQPRAKSSMIVAQAQMKVDELRRMRDGHLKNGSNELR
jgi:chromosome segregation ATPase